MGYQEQQNVIVAYKAQAGLGSIASGGSGFQFRPNSGKMQVTHDEIQSAEVRSDGMMTRSRNGMRKVTGNYEADFSWQSFDKLIGYGFRSTYGAAVTITEATGAMSSATLAVAAHTITASAGSWITSGFRVGDIIRLTAGFVAGNMSRNLRITALTATVITVLETLTVEAGPLATYTLTRSKTVLQGTTKTYLTWEEHESDIDACRTFQDVNVTKLTFNGQANQQVKLSLGLTGTGAAAGSSSSSAPTLTSPTAYTSVMLTAIEAQVLLGGVAVSDLTGFTLDIDLQPAPIPVFGSAVSPDVFQGLARVTGSLTRLRADDAHFAQMLAESAMDIAIMFAENETAPADFASLFIGGATLRDADPSDVAQSGARTQTLNFNFGKDLRGGAYDPTMVKFQSSDS